MPEGISHNIDRQRGVSLYLNLGAVANGYGAIGLGGVCGGTKRMPIFRLRERFQTHAAIIHEVAQCPESQSDELVVEGIEFAQGGNVEEATTEQVDVASEGTLRGNGFGKK